MLKKLPAYKGRVENPLCKEKPPTHFLGEGFCPGVPFLQKASGFKHKTFKNPHIPLWSARKSFHRMIPPCFFDYIEHQALPLALAKRYKIS